MRIGGFRWLATGENIKGKYENYRIGPISMSQIDDGITTHGGQNMCFTIRKSDGKWDLEQCTFEYNFICKISSK